MNIYKELNKIIEYIENNLQNEIDYNKISQILCTNEYTMKRIFYLLANISITEYIRNRRLSNAGYDLYKDDDKVIDISTKYQYDSPTAFSRAFEKFHGIKPSAVKTNPEKLRNFTKLQFNENINENVSMEYSIIQMDELILYGKGMKTTATTIHKDAPMFFKNMLDLYDKKYGDIDYGMVVYEDRFESDNYEYWIAYLKKIDEFQKIVIPKSKWLKFVINSQNAKDIQKVSIEFYENFLPSLKVNLSPVPELEYYHDGITEFLIAIED